MCFEFDVFFLCNMFGSYFNKFVYCRQMREVGERLKIPIYVFGPEVHMTYICRLALGQEAVPQDAWLPGMPNPKFLKVLPQANESVCICSLLEGLIMKY